MKTARYATWFYLGGVTIALLAMPARGKIIYVDKSGHSGGTNWKRAYPSLDAALEASEPGDEIRVSQGTYTALDYYYTRGFTVDKTVTIKGGYAGLTGADPSQRDIAAFETILSGDINGDDGPGFTNTGDNSSNVLKIEGGISPVIDGVTITAGKGRITSGGGVYITEGAQPTLISCTFRANQARHGGAVGCNWDTRSTFIGCLFIDNETEDAGGGIEGRRATIRLARCTFISNHATGRAYSSSGQGGAIYQTKGGHLETIACEFYGNTGKAGGAIFGSQGTTIVEACTFRGNKASETGGAVTTDAPMCEINGCSFLANSAGLAGGALSIYGSCDLSNSILWANTAPAGAQISLTRPDISSPASYAATASISFCDVERGLEGIFVLPEHSVSWGQGNLVTDPMLVELPDADGTISGDLHLTAGSPCRNAGDPDSRHADGIDADGEPRILDGRIDMGADEYTTVPIAIESVEISGPNEVHEEAQARFCLWGTFSDGQVLNLTELAAWSISRPEYGRLDPSGLLTLGGLDTDAELQVTARYGSNQGRLEATRTIAYVPTHRTYHVDALAGDDNDDGRTRKTALATLQQAVTLAEDGDTIWAYPGNYAGPVDFAGKAITIQGRGGGATIDGRGNFGVICENGEGSNSTLSNVVITNSYAGVFLAGSSPRIQYITAAGNHFGITAYGGAAPEIRNSIFWNNSEADLVQCEAIYSCLADDDNLLNVHSDPLFPDPAGNDYHLQSQAGRWDPSLTAWVQDDQTSPCIDAGYLPEAWDQELWPHGKRVNIGAYGNTPEASMSTRTVGLPGDLDHSGTVDSSDLAHIAQRWKAQNALLAEDLDHDGEVGFSDLIALGNSWLAPESHETIEFRDYWPFALGNRWWHTDPVSDGGLDWEIRRCFWVNGFEVWQFHKRRMGRPIGPWNPNFFYVYVNGGLYQTSDPCELETLPSPPGWLVAPEIVALDERFELPDHGKVWALQGSLAEIVAQYRGDPHQSEVGQLSEFKGGNHKDVLAFAYESSYGLYPFVIYGRDFGPMLYCYHLDGELYVLAIVKPGPGDVIVRTDIVTIQAECYQYTDRVAAVEFSDSVRTYEGRPADEIIGRDTDGQDGWSCQWPYPNRGGHVLKATALDSEGQAVGVSKEIELDVPWSGPEPTLTITAAEETAEPNDSASFVIEVEFSHAIVDGMWVEFRDGYSEIIGEDHDPNDGWSLNWTDLAGSFSHAFSARMMLGTREISVSETLYLHTPTTRRRRD